MRILIISGIRQTGREAAEALADSVRDAFVSAAAAAGCPHRPKVGKLIFGSAAHVRDALNAETEAAAQAQETLVVVYFGHGDQAGGGSRKPEEADGRDEFWRPPGGGQVLDDEITRILVGRRRRPHPPPFVLLVSDSCSSGTMIDAPLADPSRAWASVSACTDAQSAFASYEGGAFTMWGLIPALKAGCRTARQIRDYASRNMSISTQTVTVGGDADVNFFAAEHDAERERRRVASVVSGAEYDFSSTVAEPASSRGGGSPLQLPP